MDTPSAVSPDPLIGDGTMCYRPRRYFLYVGIVCTVFFLVMGVGSTCVAYWNVDGSFARPKLAALTFAVFWSAFTLFGVWLLLFYTRSRLVISITSAESTGVFRTTTIVFDNITRVKWRCFPGTAVLCFAHRTGSSQSTWETTQRVNERY